MNLHSALSVWVWDMNILVSILKVPSHQIPASDLLNLVTLDPPNLTNYTKVWLDSGPEWCRNVWGCPDVQEMAEFQSRPAKNSRESNDGL